MILFFLEPVTFGCFGLMFAVYDIYDSILLHAIHSDDFQNKSLLSQSVVLVLCLQCMIYMTLFFLMLYIQMIFRISHCCLSLLMYTVYEGCSLCLQVSKTQSSGPIFWQQSHFLEVAYSPLLCAHSSSCLCQDSKAFWQSNGDNACCTEFTAFCDAQRFSVRRIINHITFQLCRCYIFICDT